MTRSTLLISAFLGIAVIAALPATSMAATPGAVPSALDVQGIPMTEIKPATGCDATFDERHAAADVIAGREPNQPKTAAGQERERLRLMEFCEGEWIQMGANNIIRGPKAPGVLESSFEVPDYGVGTIIPVTDSQRTSARPAGTQSIYCTETAGQPFISSFGVKATAVMDCHGTALPLKQDTCLQRRKNDGTPIMQLGCTYASTTGAAYSLTGFSTGQTCNVAWDFKSWGHGQRQYAGTWAGGYDLWPYWRSGSAMC